MLKKKKRIEGAIKTLLKELGVSGFDFDDTHSRVATMWMEFLHREEPLISAFPTRTASGMIIMKNHFEYGFCPHHLLPVKYTFKIGYTPACDKVLGASKPLRITNFILKGLPLQEDIPQLVLDQIMKAEEISGCGCIVWGEHLCMRMRGVKSPCAEMVTEAYYNWTEDEVRRFIKL